MTPGGSSTDEIPTADKSTVPHNSDDSATTATSTLDPSGVRHPFFDSAWPYASRFFLISSRSSCRSSH